jgi:hypothetical protein
MRRSDVQKMKLSSFPKAHTLQATQVMDHPPLWCHQLLLLLLPAVSRAELLLHTKDVKVHDDIAQLTCASSPYD